MVKRMKMKYIDAKAKGIKAIEYKDLNKYYQNNYFKFIDHQGRVAIAVTKECKLKFDQEKVFYINKEDFVEILERDFAEENTNWAINYLSDKSPKASAKNVSYIKALTGFSIMFAGFLMLFINLFNIIE